MRTLLLLPPLHKLLMLVFILPQLLRRQTVRCPTPPLPELLLRLPIQRRLPNVVLALLLVRTLLVLILASLLLVSLLLLLPQPRLVDRMVMESVSDCLVIGSTALRPPLFKREHNLRLRHKQLGRWQPRMLRSSDRCFQPR